MTFTKIKVAAAVMFVAAGFAIGGGVVSYQMLAGESAPARERDGKAELNKANRPNDPAKADLAKMQGVWVCVEAETGGQKQPVERDRQMRVLVERSTITFNPDTENRRSVFKLDAASKPRVIELTAQDGPYKGKTAKGIYELAGGRLKLCLDNKAPPEQPTELKTRPGSSLALLVFEREPAGKKPPEPVNRSVSLDRQKSANNLRHIAIAFHSYHNDHGHLPPAVIYSKEGKPLYSWRVELLPYLEMHAVWKAFKRDEAWDSEHNKKLIREMPAVFKPVGAATKEPHTTFYQVLTGKRTIFEDRQGMKFFDAKDGTSTTIMAVEAGEPVIWTKPEDLPYDSSKPLPKLGGLFKDGFHALFCDGHVRFIPLGVKEDKLRLAIMRDDHEFLDLDRDLK